MPKDRPIIDTQSAFIASPSDSLASSVLKRTGPTDKGQHFILEQWHKIRTNQAPISQFITAASYQMAPDDAEAREQISTSMVRLYILLTEAAVQQEVTDTYGELYHDSDKTSS